ncbi:conjugal transfer protein [Streptococcus chenjunshii]|uniref:Conjugal transfer protein n=1 Tax=Streptococcus chenjunshii TaxID=2173853 RepID=A0A372KKC9_9STRE|nr:conjugal transfer protein [Streptococcus chenjunshii]AXQ77775.1 conjugal transfer protein [Streptococcus chenjunshii]RFU50497.1 conjugal transfer protein [Streptococcus chenjunshii]RFU52725.1 conjugal transfer protein [Streptococcus chenjunshii]
MGKFKNFISKSFGRIRSFFVKSENKNVKFRKADKKLVEVKLKRISQTTANRIFVGFIAGLILLSALTIMSNAFRAVKKPEQTQVVAANGEKRAYANQINLFMTGFLTAYFSGDENISDYYGPGVDIRSINTNWQERQLTNFVLVETTDEVATYRVTYVVKQEDEWLSETKVISVPYKEKNGRFYVSDLPYFINWDNYIAKIKGNYQLKNQDYSDGDYDEAKRYVEAFFKAYCSGDDTQLSPFSKNVKALGGVKFVSVDYFYFVEEEKQLVAIAQVSFSDKFDVIFSENFTLYLTTDKNRETYHVKEMVNGIVEKYKSEVQ